MPPRPAWSNARNATAADCTLAVQHGALRPTADRAEVAGGLGRRAHVGGLQRARRAPQGLRARDASLPVRRAPHRPPEDLLAGRCGGALPPPQRLPRAASDGLRRLRAAGREPRDQDRSAPARLHRCLDPRVPAPAPALGRVDRLDARVRHPRAAHLPLDPVDLPAPVREGPRLPQGGRGQVVPQGRHRARQRAGDRGPLRALRHRGRGAPARAVVLPHHRLRGPPARGHGDDRVAAERGQDAGELDRPLRGRRGGLPLRGAGHRLPGLHHPPGHAVRRHLLRDGTGAPRRVPAQRLARGARVREPRGERVGRGARRREQGEDRGGARPDGHQPGHRRADPDVRGRLRADGVRHRGDHGGARPRRARLRVRPGLRPADRARDRGRRAALHRRRPDGELRPLRRGQQPRRLRADRRVARGRGSRRALGELQAARLAAVAPALLGLPDPDRPLRLLRPRRGARRPAAGGAAGRDRLPARRAARRSPRRRTG